MFSNALMASSSPNQPNDDPSRFKELTQSTGGAYFEVKKKDFDSLFKMQLDALIGTRFYWGASNVQLKPKAGFSLPIDPGIKSFFIILTTQSGKPTFQLTDPQERSISGEVVTSNNGVICSIKEAIPGTWKLTVSSESPFDIQIRMIGNVYISKEVPVHEAVSREGEIGLIPYEGSLIPGQEAIFQLTFINPEAIANVQHVSIVDLGGAILSSTDPQIERRNKINAKLVIPKGPFRLMISGTDAQNRSFIRMGERIFNQAELKSK